MYSPFRFLLTVPLLILFLHSTKAKQQSNAFLLENESTPPAHILGNWLNPKNNLWQYGFYNDFAVTDGKFWQYEKIVSRKSKTEMLLKRGAEFRKIYLEISDDGGNLRIGSSEKNLILYTLKKNEEPDFEYYDKEDFQTPLVTEGKFHLIGLINGYDPLKDNYKFISIIYNPFNENDQKNFIAEVDSLGRFELEFPLMNPQEIMFQFSDFLIAFYAIPGSNLMMCVNKSGFPEMKGLDEYIAFTKIKRDVLFMGSMGLLNTEWHDYAPNFSKILSFKENNEYIEKSDQLEYKKYRFRIMNEQLTSVLKYSSQRHSSKKFVQQSHSRIKYSAANDLMRYRWLNKMRTPEGIKLTDAYMSFLGDIPIHNETGILTDAYPSFLKELADFLKPEIRISLQETIGYTIEKGRITDPEDERILKRYLESENNSQLSPQERRKDSLAFRTISNKYQALFHVAATNLVADRRWELTPAMKKIVDSLQAGIGRDIILAMMADEKITSKQVLNEADLAFYKEKIQRSEIFQAIAQNNAKLRTILSGPMEENINILTPIKNQQGKFFESLINKYKGKVVYVDFWAPWCGPCMTEMPRAQELKKEFTGKDVVFLYLGVNCTEETWSNTIKATAMEGEHYLLNENEYALLSNLFQISGIPRYLLISKDGIVIDSDAKRPSNKLGLITDIGGLLR